MGRTVRGSNPGGGARLSTPGQTGLGDHPASCTKGKGSFPPGVKQPGHGVDHPPVSSTEVKERVQLHSITLWAFPASSRVNFTFLPFILPCHYESSLRYTLTCLQVNLIEVPKSFQALLTGKSITT